MAKVFVVFFTPHGDPLEVPDLHAGGELQADPLVVSPAQDGGALVPVLIILALGVQDQSLLVSNIAGAALCPNPEESVRTWSEKLK